MEPYKALETIKLLMEDGTFHILFYMTCAVSVSLLYISGLAVNKYMWPICESQPYKLHLVGYSLCSEGDNFILFALNDSL